MTRAADAHDESEEDDEEAYTEDDIAAMNSAQLNRFRHKRAIVPIILGGVLALLLICLIVGVLLVKGPGQALRGYSISASNVAPIWKNKVFDWTTPLALNSFKVESFVRQRRRLPWKNVQQVFQTFRHSLKEALPG